jgi:hypothetical protein
MSRLMIEDLRAEAVSLGRDFDLEYYTDDGPRIVRAFLIRYDNMDGSQDCVVRSAESGAFYGSGDTKADAISSARINLHQRDDFGYPIGP